jgi:uncharacterized protein YjiS (DUF1127 family)
MIYGQLGRTQEAQRSLANCRRLDPAFDSRARDRFATHRMQDDLLDLFLDGLSKAGLES